MSTNDGFSGVSNCYVFKSRLQEYAQKVGFPTPVYETMKEGPSHEPFFRSTVILNDVRYDSLPGFSNRKAAEQSAAEVALTELAKSGEMNESISLPVHETGLCKNLLQEYAQKMNYAIPTYECQKDESPGRVPLFSCTVEIGGIRYIGAAARTKKEAEIKAARTALLAIQSSGDGFSDKPVGNSQLTVVPSKRKGAESGIDQEETVKAHKSKKAYLKKKQLNKKLKLLGKNAGEVENFGVLQGNMDGQRGSEVEQTDASAFQAMDTGRLAVESARNLQDERTITNPVEVEISSVQGTLVPHTGGSSYGNGQQASSNVCQSDNGNSDLGVSPKLRVEDIAALVEANMVSGVGQALPMMANSPMGQMAASGTVAGLDHAGDGSLAGVNQV
ncbi:double-stranded RNA-binding protein 1-like [Malania oleifera]|uniref:double-stranded RNA-binding protein 1-like n=1 Tax=Malania oleifera TaxID=397392 RepID=UPI0025AE6959|nr:double-stranded RNA-binding protein 1-like [Malania oleifera]